MYATGGSRQDYSTENENHNSPNFSNKSHHLSKTDFATKDNVNYEDLLVAQYLEDLRKNQNLVTRTSIVNHQASPYSHQSATQKQLLNTHVIPVNSSRTRPISAQHPKSRRKIDPKYIADPSQWEPSSPRNSRRNRPISAPVYRRPLSATYGAWSRPSSAKSAWSSGKRIKAQYKKQPRVIVTTAFKNGDREVYAKIAAPTIKMLLEMCTDKLGLPSAARLIYIYEDGVSREVTEANQIPRDGEIYVSMGEPFKNPYKPVKKQSGLEKSSAWTMTGVIRPPEQKIKRKSYLSKRFRKYLENNLGRILIFRNGQGTNESEIVADPDRYEDFLSACTAKLGLSSYARVLYDWDGKRVLNLNEVPLLDECLQKWTSSVYGPLWVSKGEGFSPKGVNEFLTNLILYTRSKLKETRTYDSQLRHAKNGEMDKVEIVAIQSMSDAEINETLELVNKDIEDFSNALNRLKQQLNKMQNELQIEQDEGYSYTLKNIKKVDGDNRMVGTKGIRIKVYENGTYENEMITYFNVHLGSRGVGNDREKLMARFLDQISDSFVPKLNPKIRPVAKHLYDKNGGLIVDVSQLEYDTEVWVSYGEAFKNPFTFCLAVMFDKIRVFDIVGRKRTTTREQLMVEDTKGNDRPSCWDIITEIPDEARSIEVGEHMDPMDKETLLATISVSEVGLDVTFAQLKNDPGVILYPELIVDTKKIRGSKELWPHDCQSWIITKSGHICSKAMPQLALTVSDISISTNLRHPTHGCSSTNVDGFAVVLQKQQGFSTQTWNFTPEGFIISQSQPELVLTYLGSRFGDDENYVKDEREGAAQGRRFYLAVCERMDCSGLRAQRWALKQERIDVLGQWKHTRGPENPEWSKRALSWPTLPDGELNPNFEWPMEGFLLPYAPSFRKKTASDLPAAEPPLRLFVLKNGSRDLKNSVAVVGPDLTNMRKDTKKKLNRDQKSLDAYQDMSGDGPLHCDNNLTILKLEFILFLERCTSLLSLPFAARRVFDESGNEHTNLSALKRDQLVFVSCGESWSDPTLSKAEQQRRHLLANLNMDVSQIRQFIQLRNPQGLVLTIDGGLHQNSPLVVQPCASERSDEEEPSVNYTANNQSEPVPVQELVRESLTAHELAHQRADERLEKMKWPWERIMNGGFSESTDEDEKNYTNKEMYRKFKPKQKIEENSLLNAQRFSYEDGFLMCTANKSLVLGVTETEGRVAEVCLVKAKADDIHQRWVIQNNGFIQAKHKPSMVLTVSMPNYSPSEEGDKEQNSYRGARVILQARRKPQFGRANQKWLFDEKSGFIVAFNTDLIDKEITAAIKANVCTFAVMGGTEIDQPGYHVNMSTDKTVHPLKILVCSSCARAMRGRHKLERVETNVDFSCAMGSAKEHGIKQIGSFKCLNGKVDLSTYEASHSLEEWEGQMIKLKEELSVRAIAKEISAARLPYSVKVSAYRNGEGRRNEPELIVGSSISGILDQATSRLQINKAARQLFTSDGTLVLDIDDLIEWARNFCVLEACKQRKEKQKQIKDKNEDSAKTSQHQNVKNITADEIADIVVGYEISEKRQYLDPWTDAVMIPNPVEEIVSDGIITHWNYYARAPGKLYLQVFRPDPVTPARFRLIDQIVQNPDKPGAYSVDMRMQPGWDGVGMLVNAGDVLAFHSLGASVIPFDEDESMNQSPFYMQSLTELIVNSAYTMETTDEVVSSRKYSLNANVVPLEKMKQILAAQELSEESPLNKAIKVDTSEIKPPSVEMILRYPIEVWVSCGEPFVHPQKVDLDFERNIRERDERASVSYELEKEKHTLRQMQGRRIEKQDPGHFHPTKNPLHPVLIEGSWQDPSLQEIDKHHTVHGLMVHLSEVKASQDKKRRPKSSVPLKNTPKNPSETQVRQRLYTQPVMKRVLVFFTGDSISQAVYVWGENLAQLLDNANSRIQKRREGKYFFDSTGQLITDFSEIERDQILCLSSTKIYQEPRELNEKVEVKANWGRARRQYGEHATDIVVKANPNPHVDVDPFGPSALAGGPTQSQRPGKALESTNAASPPVSTSD